MWIVAICAVLVLIKPVFVSSEDTQETGIQSSQGQAKDATRSADETSARWKAAGECLVAGNRDCILENLDQIIEEDPEAWEAYALRARVRDETGDRVGAESDRKTLAGVGGTYAAIENRLSQAIDLNPGDSGPVWRRAVHRWQAGNDAVGALSDLDLVIVLSDGVASKEVHMMRAKLLEVQEDHDGAILDYSTVIELESGYETTALTERARLLGLVGRSVDAERDLEILAEIDQAMHDDRIIEASKRIEAHPEDIMSLYMRGMEYADRDDLGAALRDAETIMRLDPEGWLGYSLRSKVRRKTGDISGYREDRAMVRELSGKQN